MRRFISYNKRAPQIRWSELGLSQRKAYESDRDKNVRVEEMLGYQF